MTDQQTKRTNGQTDQQIDMRTYRKVTTIIARAEPTKSRAAISSDLFVINQLKINIIQIHKILGSKISTTKVSEQVLISVFVNSLLNYILLSTTRC